MMFFRAMIILFLVTLLVGGNTSGISRSFKTSINDKELQSMSIVLDNAILNYYTNHSELPEYIDNNILHIMGLSDYDLSKFTYQKLADNKFMLTAELSNQETWISSYSNKDLPKIELEQY